MEEESCVDNGKLALPFLERPLCIEQGWGEDVRCDESPFESRTVLEKIVRSGEERAVDICAVQILRGDFAEMSQSAEFLCNAAAYVKELGGWVGWGRREEFEYGGVFWVEGEVEG